MYRETPTDLARKIMSKASTNRVSRRMIRYQDMLTAYARWLALIGIPIAALLTPADQTPLLLLTLIMAVIDAIPIVMLYFKFYPVYAAITFFCLDIVFALIALYLGGPGVLFYAFIPALAIGVRFDWMWGLSSAALLAVGHIFIALLADPQVEVAALIWQAALLLLASAWSGLLAHAIKAEPPMTNQEQQALNEKMRRLQAAADRAQIVYEMSSTLSATLNPEKILNAVLEIGSLGFDELDNQPSTPTPATPVEHPAGVVLLQGEEGLYVAASRNISAEEAELTLSPERGVLGRTLYRGESQILGKLADDPVLSRFASFRRCRSAICVPLRAGFETFGAVLFASPLPNAFQSEHQALLTAIASQAAVALNNAQLYQDLQSEKERTIAVVEESRTKLSRDLHDGPTQSISAIAMRLNFARLLLDREPSKVKEELFKLENLARRTTKEIRTMLFTLRPVVLETQGLQVAVEQLVTKLQETGDLPVRLQIANIEDKIDVNLKAVAWFITEEALNNARKYAQAKNIWVRMSVRENYFVAEIEDDGVGFDMEATMSNYDQRGSFGLLNMQERADLVNGRTSIKSEKGKGTKVTLVAPLNREAA